MIQSLPNNFQNHQYSYNQMPDYLTGSYKRSNFPVTIENDIDNNTLKTFAFAGVLQAFASSLNQISRWLSSKLVSSKEFTTADKVKQVANHMVNNNKLNVHVGYIDDYNKHLYAQNYGLAKEFEVVSKGKNAFFIDRLKLAVAPNSKPSLILHELGHAINASKPFTKFLQMSRRIAPLAPVTLLFANNVFGRKNDGEKTFIERHAGKLGFMAYLPTIVEEGLASLRGINAAKKVLGNSANLNLLKKNYAIALGTYILAGIGLGVASKQAIVESKLHN